MGFFRDLRQKWRGEDDAANLNDDVAHLSDLFNDAIEESRRLRDLGAAALASRSTPAVADAINRHAERRLAPDRIRLAVVEISGRVKTSTAKQRLSAFVAGQESRLQAENHEFNRLWRDLCITALGVGLLAKDEGENLVARGNLLSPSTHALFARTSADAAEKRGDQDTARRLRDFASGVLAGAPRPAHPVESLQIWTEPADDRTGWLHTPDSSLAIVRDDTFIKGVSAETRIVFYDLANEAVPGHKAILVTISHRLRNGDFLDFVRALTDIPEGDASIWDETVIYLVNALVSRTGEIDFAFLNEAAEEAFFKRIGQTSEADVLLAAAADYFGVPLATGVHEGPPTSTSSGGDSESHAPVIQKRPPPSLLSEMGHGIRPPEASRSAKHAAFEQDLHELVKFLSAGLMGPPSAPAAVDRFGGVQRLDSEAEAYVQSITNDVFASVIREKRLRCGEKAWIEERDTFTATFVNEEWLGALRCAIWAEMLSEIWKHASLWSSSASQPFIEDTFDLAEIRHAKFHPTFGPSIMALTRDLQVDPDATSFTRILGRIRRAFEMRGIDVVDLDWLSALSLIPVRAMLFNRAALQTAGAVDEKGLPR